MQEQKKILIIEDSRRLNNFMASQLQKTGYEAVQAESGKDAYEILKTTCVDLVILDLNLGDFNGMDILKTIRRQDKTLPVMIVSSINSDETKIEGFRIGCDDYLTKPFFINDMMMRIGRMIERSEIQNISPIPIQETLTAGPFELDTAAFTVKKNGTALPMRKRYFDMLMYFIQNQGTAIPFRSLYENVWGNGLTDEQSIENNLYVNIRQLRTLIEDDPADPKYVLTIRHVGYMFMPSGT